MKTLAIHLDDIVIKPITNEEQFRQATKRLWTKSP